MTTAHVVSSRIEEQQRLISSDTWDRLNVQEQELFMSLDFKLVEEQLGICTGDSYYCRNNYTKLYSVQFTYPSIMHNNDGTFFTNYIDTKIDYLCKDCIRERVLRTGFKTLYTEHPGLRHDYILPSSMFPETTYDYSSCAACSFIIIKESDPFFDPDERFRNRNLHTYLLDDDDEPTILVHTHCVRECTVCNKEYPTNYNDFRIDDEHVCEKCFDEKREIGLYFCEQCDSAWYSEDSLKWSLIRSEMLCVSCYDQYVECDDCNEEYYEDDGHTCEEDNDSNLIASYSYKPYPRFYTHKNKPVVKSDIFMGIELEVESRQHDRCESAEHVIAMLRDRVYLKEDGSISHGYEIVTHPHTLEAYQKDIRWEFLNDIKNMGMRSWNTGSCGLHVHINRASFMGDNYAQREAHYLRFNKLIYDNQRQVERIAGRSSSYAKFSDKGNLVAKVKDGQQISDRYSAVNMEPDDTLEIRVFRGSLRKERVLSAIEFVHAAAEYTRYLKVDSKHAPFSWARFVSYISANSDTYPNLFIIINETFARDSLENGDL